MRILLTAINAKYIHSNLAVYNLKAVTAKYGDQIEIAEYTINQQPDEILADIYKKQPDVIAFSTYIWNRRMVGELIEELSKVLPRAEIWAGGPEVSYDAEAFLMEYPKVRGVMRGEGETVFPALASLYIEGTGSFQTIAGITYRNDHGELQINEDGAPANMDELPFVYGHLEDFSHKIIYYESSRGCPFRCAYCLSSLEKKLRFRSLDLVKKELGFFLQAKVPQVKFLDRTFNCNPRRTVDLWQWILDHDNGITNFHFEIAADLITEEELAIMKQMRPGLIQLEIGVQSTNMETVHEIDRVMDLDLVRNVTAKVKSFGNIHQHLDLIAGLPYEDYNTFHRSFNDVYEMKPDQLQLGFLKVLKGSLMEQEAQKYGILHKEKEPYEVLSTNWLSYREILKLKRVESMVEVYYNSGQFQNTLEYLVPQFEDAFIFYEKLGAFYEEKGYSEISHSRMRRYEILLEFLKEETQIDAETAAQYMLYDLYLRERLKKRPSFAADQKPYESAVWAYRKEHRISRTAHIEVFPGGKAILFDYENRNPLSNNAATENVVLRMDNEIE